MAKGVDHILIIRDQFGIAGNELQMILRTVDNDEFVYNRDQCYSSSLDLYRKVVELCYNGLNSYNVDVLLIYSVYSLDLHPILDLFCSVFTDHLMSLRMEAKSKTNLYFEKIVSDIKTYYQYCIPGFPMSPTMREINSIMSDLIDQNEFISSVRLRNIFEDIGSEYKSGDTLDETKNIPSQSTFKRYYTILKSSIEKNSEMEDFRTRGFSFKSPSKKAW
jgi:hypothetical protein